MSPAPHRIPVHRVLTALLTLGLLASLAAPVAANEPTATPAASPATEPPPSELPIGPDGQPMAPSIHAEMLAEHAADAVSFTPGEAPSVAMATPSGDGGLGDGTTSSTDGGVAALPNGLRKEIFGYLPYWMLSSSNLAHLDYDMISTIAYFGVAARSDGTLARTADSVTTPSWAGWTSSHMTDVINKAHARGVKVVLTVTMMAWNGNYTEMSAFLNSSSARNRLVGEIVGTVRDRRADGVNLDFEPVPASLRDQYTSFVRQLKAGLQSAGVGSFLTVATMAGAATWSSGYDVAALSASGAADALMVMAYDFSWSGSARAGGVAPVRNPYIFDVNDAIRDYLAKVPAGKLIWGVPYYGREWSTDTNALYSETNRKRTSVAYYYTGHRTRAGQHGRLWDSTGQVPWYRFHDSAAGTWVQGYYDDVASLTAKYNLINLNDMRGVGIWHLLMDNGRAELWDALDTHFQGPWFTDAVGSQFQSDILWLAESGITQGCGEDLFCPNQAVTRGQMAAFLSRALELPATGRDFFSDDGGSIFHADINRLAAAGIASGCGDRRFCPNGAVTRGQMAAFLSRALELPATGRDFFSDDGTSIFHADINRLAASGITSGCDAGRFCPNAAVTRGEMAAFLRRAMTR